MELNIVTFKSGSLITHEHKRATAEVLIDTRKADVYCFLETYLESRNNAQFPGYNIIRNDNKTGASFLVRKEHIFEEVINENLLAFPLRRQ